MKVRGVFCVWAILVSACSSTPDATEPAATASAELPAPEVTAAASAPPVPSETVSASASASPPAATSPKSGYVVGGKSLSDVDFTTLQAEVKKAGYELLGPPSVNVCGKLEITQLGIGKKGKPAGVMALHRPATTPTTNCTPTSNKESLAAWQKGIDDPKGTTASLFDEQPDVLLIVNLMKENKAAAQKLLEALAKKP